MKNIVFLASLFFATNLFAMPESGSPDMDSVGLKDKFRNKITETCTKSFSSKNEKYKDSMPFMDMEKLSEAACSCTLDRFLSDAKINQLFSLPDDEFKKRTDTPDFKAYFFALFTSSGLICLGSAMDDQMRDADLKF